MISPRALPEDRGYDTPCWIWQLAIHDNGYGAANVPAHMREPGQYQQTTAHRLAYIEANGPIPADLVVDHLCRQRDCVNPDHLEVVTQQVNTRRGIGPSAVNAVKTHCKYGHPFDAENTYVCPSGRRRCRTCRREERLRREGKAVAHA